MIQMPTTDAQAAPPLASVADAEAAMRRLGDVIDELVETLTEETVLVRAGRLSEVVRIRERKSELARRYLADTNRLRAALPRFAAALPAATVGAFRERHETFSALLQSNLTVLATAHAVSEGIMRGVADEMSRKSAPQTYGASGRQGTPDPRLACPLTLSRAV